MIVRYSLCIYTRLQNNDTKISLISSSYRTYLHLHLANTHLIYVQLLRDLTKVISILY